MKTFVRILMPALIVATLFAAFVGVEVASAALESVTWGTQGAAVTYAGGSTTFTVTVAQNSQHGVSLTSFSDNGVSALSGVTFSSSPACDDVNGNNTFTVTVTVPEGTAVGTYTNDLVATATRYTDTTDCGGGADGSTLASSGTENGTLTIGQATQTITFTSTAPSGKVYSGSNNQTYTVTATASSGLTPTFTIDSSSTSGCTISGSTVSYGLKPGTCVIDANQAGNTDYSAAPQVQQSFTIGQATQTITFTSTAPSGKVYSGSNNQTYTVTATASSGLTPTFTIDSSSTSGCTISGSTVSYGLKPGTCVIDANQAGNTDYSAAPQVQQSFTIGQATQTITFTSTAPSGKVYSGSNNQTYTVTATASSGLTPTFTIDSSSTSGCTISGSTVSYGLKPGTCVIDANQAGNTDYSAAPQVQQSFTIGQATQTITFTSTAPSGKVYSGSNNQTYTVTATASSGLTPTFTIDSSSTSGCTISGSTVSYGLKPGTCVIDANQAGNTDYSAAPQVQQSFTIGQATPSVTVTNNSVSTGGSLVFTATVAGPSGGASPTGTLTWAVTSPKGGSVSCSSTSGPAGSSNSVTYTCTISAAIAGTYSATATYPGDSNYNSNSGSDTSASVAAQTIPQSSPTSGSTTTTSSSGFSAQLNPQTFNGQPVTFTVTTSVAGISVSSTGAVTTSGTLAVGTYTISGTDADGIGDTGTWSFQLTVTGTTISQSAPTSGSTTTTSSSGFSAQLNPTSFNGAPVTFTVTSASSPAGLSVSSTGAVTTSGTLAVGTYTISGTDADGIGDTGTWSFSLVVSGVSINQSTPTSGSTTTTSSSGFSAQLNPQTFNGQPVTYTVTSASSPAGLSVSSTGFVTTSGTLAAGTYTISGTDRDPLGNTGTWSFQLTVTGTTISQSAPTSGSTTTTSSSGYTNQLNPTSFNGQPVTFTVTSASSPAGLSVSSTGAVTTSGYLAAGTYTISGTDADGLGDTGTWSFQLTVTGTTISQSAPTSGSTTTTSSSGFSAQLNPTSFNGAPVTYTVTSASSPAGLSVSSTGAVTTSGYLAAGTYTISGTDADGLGDTGTWSFQLTVTGTTISQSAPTSGSTTTTSSSGFSAQLNPTSFNGAPVTYTVTSASSPAGLSVSSTGAVTTSGYLAAGTYTISGTDADGLGDTGTWSFQLTVTGTTISQSAPTSGSTTTTSSSGFSAQLNPTSFNGAPVTYTVTSASSPAGLSVSSTGAVTTSGYLAAGTYTISGTDADGLGDTGTWSFQLTVTGTTISQSAPTSGSTTTTSSSGYTNQLNPQTFNGQPVTYTVTSASSPAGLSVSSTGFVTTSGTLAAGTYTISGTDADGIGDTGTWSFQLTVTGTTISQSAPTSGSTTTTSSSGYTNQLNPTSFNGAPVTYTVTSASSPAGLSVSSTGFVTTSGYLAAGTYTISGTDADGLGDTGTWSFSLTVSGVSINQSTPTGDSITTTATSGYTNQLNPTSFNGAPVTYTVTSASSPAGLSVSSTGAVSTSGYLAAGTYTISGTDADGLGDTGTWSFSLTVSGVSINQSTPTGDSITTTATSGYTNQLNPTSFNGAPVTYTVTSASSPAGLSVSSTGAVTTSGTLAVGTYTISGTDADGIGDTGTWSFQLTVTGTTISQSAPTSGSTTTTSSSGFSAQLNPTSFNGAPVTFTVTSASSPAGLSVSSTGAVTTSGYLAAGTYTISGTDADGLGDTGTWSFQLTVTGTTISQSAPTSGSTTTTSSSGYTNQLNPTSFNGAPVTFTVTSASSPAGLSVSSTGAVTTSGYLAAGTYTISGTDADGLGDTGTWSFQLTVTGTTISQSAPTSGSTTTTSSSGYTNQLNPQTFNGQPVTYTVTSASSPAGLSVSSTGFVTTSGTLAAGTYTISGTDADGIGDTGTWSFQLTVTGTTISQSAPTSGSTTTTSSSGYTNQLNPTSFNGAPVTYTVTSASSPAGLSVSSTGFVTTSGTLAAGTYTISGTDADGLGDTGTWSFSLTVSGVSINQSTPTSGSTTTTSSSGFSAQLNPQTFNGQPVTFTVTSASSPAGLSVSSTGFVTTSGTLAAGTYTISGTDADGIGDTGTWSFQLTVTGTTISQSAPTSGSTTTTSSSGYTNQLNPTSFNGQPVTYTVTSASSPAGLSVSSTGFVTTSGYLAAGTYTISGTDADGLGDTGTWSFSLTVSGVSINQSTPTGDSITTTATSGYTNQLNPTSFNGAPVTFTVTSASSPAGLSVSSTGAVSTSGYLAAGTYTISGTDADGLGDTGTWSFSLTVSGVSINQSTPTGDSITTTATSGYTNQLNPTSFNGAPVTFTVTSASSPAGLSVSSTGAVSTSGYLAAGTYTISGTDADGLGDTGTWSFSLTVSGVSINQSTPTSGAITTTATSGYTNQLNPTSFNGQPVTYTVTSASSPAGLSVSSTGAVSTSGYLAAGTYTISGTDADGIGDTGTWSFSLVVSGVSINQSTPTGDSITTTATSGYTNQLNPTSFNGAPVTYTVTSASSPAGLSVSSTGFVTTSGYLAAGTYTISGTDADGLGDTGTWSFSLTVSGVSINQSTPTGDSITTTATSGYTNQLNPTSFNGAPVTYTVTSASSPAGLSVSSTGAVSTSGYLAAGTYTISGTDADGLGDTGTWSFSLTVSGVSINQSTPTGDSITTTATSGYTNQLNPTSFNGAPVTFTVTSASSPAGLSVSSTGAVSTSGYLAAGTYTISGTDADGLGDTGTWSFSLTVSGVSINQSTPTGDSITTTATSGYTNQLNPTSFNGQPVTYTVTSASSPAGLSVSSTGAVTTSGYLAAGTYTISGTDADGIGDTGTWSFSLTVTGISINQSTPTSGATVYSLGFTDQLNPTSFNGAPVTFTVTSASSPAGLSVSSTGAVTTSGTLAAGTYTISGTDADGLGDTGTWSYTLVVSGVAPSITSSSSASGTTVTSFSFTVTTSGNPTPTVGVDTADLPSWLSVSYGSGTATLTGMPPAAGTYQVFIDATNGISPYSSQTLTITVSGVSINQSTPTGDSITTTATSGYTNQLNPTSFNGQPVTYTVTSASSPAGLSVSSTGAVTTSGYLAAGTYTISGTDADGIGDTGTWSFSLTVTGISINQSTPTSGATVYSLGFTDQLNPTSFNGAPVTFTVTSASSPAGLSVSSTGAVTTSGTLAAGTYTISGTDADGLGDTGTWSYTLVVSGVAPSITSSSSASGTTVTSFSFTVTTSGNPTPTVGVDTADLPSWLSVSYGSGTATLTGMPPAAGTYQVFIDATNGISPYSSQTLTITVSGVSINQSTPTGDSITTTATSGYTNQLNPTSFNGQPVTYTVTSASSPAGLSVSSTGAVTTSGYLAAGTYTISGTDADGLGDTGTWSFQLTVTGTTISQSAPTSGSTTTTSSSGFSAQLNPTSFNGAPVTYTVTSASSPAGLSVSSTGAVTTSGTLAVGTYTISGTDADGLGDTGTWSFQLTVTGTTISQSAPTSGSTTTTSSSGFSAQLNPTSFNGAPVTFTVTSASSPAGLSVSSTGAVTTSGTLAVGTYTISGTDADGLGDTGTWSFSLTVSGVAPSITSSSSASGTTGTAFSFTVTTSGTPTPTVGVDTADLPSWLSVSYGSGTATLTGTPTTPGTYQVFLDATNGISPYASQTLTITVGGTAPQITSSSSASGTTGTAFSFTVTTSGTPTPTVGVDTADLPSWLHVSYGSGTATLTGTPTTPGTYQVFLDATNGISPYASQTLTITVGGTAPQITSSSSASGTTGTAFSFTVTTSGTPTPTVGVDTADLPSWLSVSYGSGTATLTGTPTTPGTYQVFLDATNGISPYASQTLTITVGGTAPQITSSSSASGTTGTAFSFTVTTSGTPTPTVGVDTADLPSWLHVSYGSGTATLTGTPTTPGTYQVFLDATNGISPYASQTLTITVGGTAPQITSSSSASGTTGTAFSFTVTTSGTPTPTVGVDTADLPSWLSVSYGSGTATLTGTPTTPGTYQVFLDATNGISPYASQTLTITVGGTAPQITSSSSASGTTGTAFSFTVTTSGTPTPTVGVDTADLPSWLHVSYGSGTATLTGTPTTPGTYQVFLDATNGISPYASQTLTITVGGTAPQITSSSSASGTTGTAFSFTVTTSGTPTPTVGVDTADLPSWLHVSYGSGTATLTGTPTTPGTYQVFLDATNGISPYASQTLTITVAS